jgi:hypothetical protein
MTLPFSSNQFYPLGNDQWATKDAVAKGIAAVAKRHFECESQYSILAGKSDKERAEALDLIRYFFLSKQKDGLPQSFGFEHEGKHHDATISFLVGKRESRPITSYRLNEDLVLSGQISPFSCRVRYGGNGFHSVIGVKVDPYRLGLGIKNEYEGTDGKASPLKQRIEIETPLPFSRFDAIKAEEYFPINSSDPEDVKIGKAALIGGLALHQEEHPIRDLFLTESKRTCLWFHVDIDGKRVGFFEAAFDPCQYFIVPKGAKHYDPSGTAQILSNPNRINGSSINAIPVAWDHQIEFEWKPEDNGLTPTPADIKCANHALAQVIRNDFGSGILMSKSSKRIFGCNLYGHLYRQGLIPA